jgi:hypothetical protein
MQAVVGKDASNQSRLRESGGVPSVLSVMQVLYCTLYMTCTLAIQVTNLVSVAEVTAAGELMLAVQP